MRRMRGLAVLLVAVSTTLPGPAHAAADDPPLLAYADVWVDHWAGSTAYVCAEGRVNDGTPVAVEWTYATAGTVSGVPFPELHNGPVFTLHCAWIDTTGAAPGWWFSVSLTYAGVGESDLAGAAGVTVYWNPTGPPDELGYGPNRTPAAA